VWSAPVGTSERSTRPIASAFSTFPRLPRYAREPRGVEAAGRLRALLATHIGPSPETRSALEHRFLDLCHRAGLPTPAINVPVCDYEVDALWPAQRLVVELDGYAFHHARKAFESDRTRDAALQLAGYRVLRVTHRRLVDDPSAVIETIRKLLAAGPGA
jgi:uncharacterized protein DUF559